MDILYKGKKKEMNAFVTVIHSFSIFMIFIMLGLMALFVFGENPTSVRDDIAMLVTFITFITFFGVVILLTRLFRRTKEYELKVTNEYICERIEDDETTIPWDKIVEAYIPKNPKKTDIIRISYMPDNPYVEIDESGKEQIYADGYIVGLGYYDEYLDIIEKVSNLIETEKVTHTKVL